MMEAGEGQCKSPPRHHAVLSPLRLRIQEKLGGQ
jgi:hypothetical protein